tara:strand:- start:37668 stop:41672 length:4005 start_codon:yes stop_codon:yes gene_type:complete
MIFYNNGYLEKIKMKKTLFSLLSLAILITVVFIVKNNNHESYDKIAELRKQHEEFLRNSPFKETLKLSKEQRKAKGIPPNKYFEEQWELTMNPALGKPTSENLKYIQEGLAKRRGQGGFAKVPGDKADNNWIERGPNNVGGRTRAVMFDPNDATNEIVFAGGVSGGLWKNTNISNAVSQWQKLDIPENLAVSSIAYDPNNLNIFYVGTGESYVGGDVNGNGVWKSTDRGSTWVNVFGGISGDSFYQSATNLSINSPVAIAGDYLYQPTSNFGSQITAVITADVVLVDDSTVLPTEGCNALVNGASINGKIALIRRGSCNFTDKVKNAQNAGAIAAIVMNNIDGAPTPMGGSDASITIPAVMITKADGDLIETTLITETVNVSLNPRNGDFTGILVPGIQHINDIVIRDNAGVSEIYAAAGDSFYSDANATTFLGGPEFGLYKSIDGGLNWEEISLGLTTNGNKYCPNDIEVGADNKIWISTINSTVFGDGGGTVLSSSDGVTFEKTYEITEGNRTQITTSSSDAQKIYVLAEGSGTSPIIMEKTEDGFTSTTSMTLPNDVYDGIPANDFTNGQAFYDLIIKANPLDDAIVYVGGIDLFKTVDSGATWSQITEYYSSTGLNEVHPDQHVIVFGNEDISKILFGNDGGVYYSGDGGITIEERNNGYNVTQFYTVGVAPTTALTGDYFLAGAQDNGTQVFQSSNPNGPDESFRAVGGDGAFSFFDQDGIDRYFIANVVYNDGIYLFDYDTGEWVTINDESTAQGSFINPEALDSNLNILYSNYSSGANAIIKRYSGIKDASTLIKVDLTNNLLTSRPTALTVSPYTKTSSTLYVGTILGDVLKIEKAEGGTPIWNEISGSSFVGSVSDIEFGRNEYEIFVTMHNYGVVNVWYTNDGGANWKNKEGNLPDLPVKAILQNPLNSNEVIVGTDLGVWYTDNFSADAPDWNSAFNGMSNVKVTDLDLRNDNMVFASTYGRGVFSGEFTLDPNGDLDGDTVPNGIDNCPEFANTDQADIDGNGIGDVCQDTDKDSIIDINDNCPERLNFDQIDADGNGIGDACEDFDNDGIIDLEDNCMELANPDQQDTNGNGIGDLCDTSYEAPDNISLEIISETCQGLNNGIINITTKETYVTYTATLTGTGFNLSEGFVGSYSFVDIAVGSYIVCVSVDGKDFEQCFEINIDVAEVLNVVLGKIEDNSDKTSIIIDQGTPPFNVTFNGQTLRTTSEKSFEIETPISGTLEISSAKACEGTFKTMINKESFEKVAASPNPVVNLLKVTLPFSNDKQIPVQIYNIGGKLVFNQILNKGQSNFIEIPFEKFDSGIYFVKVNIEKPKVFKIIK